MNYYHYKAEDFASDDEFKRWVCTPDPESDAFWREFLAENPEKYYAVEEARRLVLGLRHLPLRPGAGKQAGRIWQRIEDTVGAERRSRTMRLLSWAAAAVVVLAVGLGWWQQAGEATEIRVAGPFEKSVPADDRTGWKEVINTTPDTMSVWLPDGSLVVLEKDSRLKYGSRFDDSLRALYLQGEAFFEVKKDAGRPFMVHANGLVTKVLGTSFSIRAREDDPNVTVSVKTGRVSVYTDKAALKPDPEATGIVLSPNQKAVFERDGETLSKTLVEKPEVLRSITPVSFVFDSAPAREVFEALEQNYGIEVFYDEELLKDCLLTLDLTKEDLFQKLQVICRVLDANYKLIEAQVIIYGNGCS